ncbi:unnamed protein product [Amoebophrya sp. A25]|nr:unnamed protein product [Amoebophrya sp. A25]|eukprot:GSA25T00022647001.1
MGDRDRKRSRSRTRKKEDERKPKKDGSKSRSRERRRSRSRTRKTKDATDRKKSRSRERQKRERSRSRAKKKESKDSAKSSDRGAKKSGRDAEGDGSKKQKASNWDKVGYSDPTVRKGFVTADHGGNIMRSDATVSTTSSAVAMGFATLPAGGTVQANPGDLALASTTGQVGVMLPNGALAGPGTAVGVSGGVVQPSGGVVVHPGVHPNTPVVSNGVVAGAGVPGGKGAVPVAAGQAGARAGYVASCWMQRPLFTEDELKSRTLIVQNLSPTTKANQLMTFVNTFILAVTKLQMIQESLPQAAHNFKPVYDCEVDFLKGSAHAKLYFRSFEGTQVGLNLNGLEYEGCSIRVMRPVGFYSSSFYVQKVAEENAKRKKTFEEEQAAKEEEERQRAEAAAAAEEAENQKNSTTHQSGVQVGTSSASSSSAQQPSGLLPKAAAPVVVNGNNPFHNGAAAPMSPSRSIPVDGASPSPAKSASGEKADESPVGKDQSGTAVVEGARDGTSDPVLHRDSANPRPPDQERDTSKANGVPTASGDSAADSGMAVQASDDKKEVKRDAGALPASSSTTSPAKDVAAAAATVSPKKESSSPSTFTATNKAVNVKTVASPPKPVYQPITRLPDNFFQMKPPDMNKLTLYVLYGIPDPEVEVMEKLEQKLKKHSKLSFFDAPVDMTESQLRDLFLQFGPLKYFELMVHRDGASKGYGMLEYEPDADMDYELIFDCLNGFVVGEKALKVQHLMAQRPPIGVQPVPLALPSGTAAPVIAPVKLNTVSSKLFANPVVTHRLQTGLSAGRTPSAVVQLLNAVFEADVMDDKDCESIRREVHAEATNFGIVEEVRIPRPDRHGLSGDSSAGVGKIFVHFQNVTSARRFQAEVNGRKFDERVVCAAFYPRDRFLTGLFSLDSTGFR